MRVGSECGGEEGGIKGKLLPFSIKKRLCGARKGGV
jgi:hypothetical protein